ncbi:MAG: rod shape-determining protein MreD [Eubacterium sp.]|nr:rod shape-determining protein MreD [Eubacterium sp.]
MIKKTLVSIVIILIAFLLQTTVFHAFALANVVPNILLVVTVSYGYIRGRTHGMWIGLVCGLMLDMMFESVIGLCGFILMTIGFFIGYIRKIFFTDGIWMPVVLISVGDFAYCMYYYVTEFLLRGRLHFFFYFLHVMLPEIVYTVIVGTAIFYLIRILEDFLTTTHRREEEI